MNVNRENEKYLADGTRNWVVPKNYLYLKKEATVVYGFAVLDFQFEDPGVAFHEIFYLIYLATKECFWIGYFITVGSPFDLRKFSGYPKHVIQCNATMDEMIEYWETLGLVSVNGPGVYAGGTMPDYNVYHLERHNVLSLWVERNPLVTPVERMVGGEVIPTTSDVMFPEIMNFTIESVNGRGAYIPFGFSIDYVKSNDLWRNGLTHYVLINQKVSFNPQARGASEIVDVVPIVGNVIGQGIDAYSKLTWYLYWMPISFLAARSDFQKPIETPDEEQAICDMFQSPGLEGVGNADIIRFRTHKDYNMFFREGYEALIEQNRVQIMNMTQNTQPVGEQVNVSEEHGMPDLNRMDRESQIIFLQEYYHLNQLSERMAEDYYVRYQTEQGYRVSDW